MPSYIYPSSQDLSVVEQNLLPRLTADSPVFDILPIDTQDATLLKWQQKDNYKGLQSLRGLNGEPPRITRVSINEYMMRPGVYGEFGLIDEAELTERRKMGSFDAPIDITDLVAELQEQLLTRRLNRIEQIGWTLLTTGTFSVSSETGAVLHTDSYTFQTSTPVVPWATIATATPLADFRAVQLLNRGYSVNFGKEATAFMNRSTWNDMIRNTNASDLYGRRTAGLGTYENIGDINKLLAGDDLPQIVIYDGGYLNAAGTFTLFIPNNKVVVIGKRPGGKNLGNYTMTRNANNPNLAPGASTKVVDNSDREVPRKISVYDLHNGGPRFYYPSAVVVMTV